MILVDGLYINKGGGAVLLQYLIHKILEHPQKNEFFFLLDPRFTIPAQLTNNYVVIPNKLKDRLQFYKASKGKYKAVFCFANTPPPIHMGVPVYTYSHNQKLLEAPHQKFKRAYLKLYIKYLFIKMYNKNTDYYIVQTKHMVEEMMKVRLKDAQHCLTLPFYDMERYQGTHPVFDIRPVDEFAFVSTPSPQKNYPTLLDTWEYLFELGKTPALHITVDNTAPDLLQRIEAMQQKGMRIHNYSWVDPKELYYKYRYLICPSVMESFGLPLIEATASGMKVLAPDLPYVYDVIRPSATFNPWSKEEMAQAVIKAMEQTLPNSTIVTTNQVNELISLLLSAANK